MKLTKNTMKRALRTFVQAVIAYLAVHLSMVDFSNGKEAVKTALLGLAVSSLAAGLSAVMNLEKKGDGTNDNG